MAVGSGVTVAAGTVVTVGLGVLVSVGDDVTVDRGVVVGNWVAVEAGLAVEPSLQLLIRVARVKAINPVRRRLDISSSRSSVNVYIHGGIQTQRSVYL